MENLLISDYCNGNFNHDYEYNIKNIKNIKLFLCIAHYYKNIEINYDLMKKYLLFAIKNGNIDAFKILLSEGDTSDILKEIKYLGFQNQKIFYR